MKRRFLPFKLLSAAGAALVLGALVGLAPFLASSADSFGDGTDRGDSPVVGSLPCIVDPVLDDLFHIPLGRSFTGPPPQAPAVMGVIGADLSHSILGASGDPFGILNRAGGWTVLALHRPGQIVLDRAHVISGAVQLWEWVPDGYLGGRVRATADFWMSSFRISSNSFALPVGAFALHGGNFAVGCVRIDGPAGQALPSRDIRVVLTPTTVILQHQP